MYTCDVGVFILFDLILDLNISEKRNRLYTIIIEVLQRNPEFNYYQVHTILPNVHANVSVLCSVFVFVFVFVGFP